MLAYVGSAMLSLVFALHVSVKPAPHYQRTSTTYRRDETLEYMHWPSQLGSLHFRGASSVIGIALFTKFGWMLLSGT